MKKSVLVALGALFTIALTGCVRMDLNVDVKKDGTGEYNMVLAYNGQYFKEDQIKGDSNEPIKHYDYDGQDWIGYEKSQEFDTWEDMADDLQGLKGAGNDGSSSGVFKSVEINKKSGLFGTTYTFDAETVPVSGDSSMGSMDSYVKFKINVNMPGKVVEGALENATVNDDGTVAVDYNADKAVTVHIETKESGALAIILIIVAVLVVVAAVAIVIVVVLKKKSNASVDSVAAAPVTPSVDTSSDFTPASPVDTTDSDNF